jgi:hypothetical protein
LTWHHHDADRVQPDSRRLDAMLAHPEGRQLPQRPHLPKVIASRRWAIFGSEEDRFKTAASKIEDSAHRTIEEQDRQAHEVGEEISQLVISSRSVRDQIAAGSIPSGEALERLAGFREQHHRIVARPQSIKAVYERQLEIAKDPGAAVDDLRRRFPAPNL